MRVSDSDREEHRSATRQELGQEMIALLRGIRFRDHRSVCHRPHSRAEARWQQCSLQRRSCRPAPMWRREDCRQSRQITATGPPLTGTFFIDGPVEKSDPLSVRRDERTARRAQTVEQPRFQVVERPDHKASC